MWRVESVPLRTSGSLAATKDGPGRDKGTINRPCSIFWRHVRMWIADSFASDLARGAVPCPEKNEMGELLDDGSSDAVVRPLAFPLIDHRTAPFQKFVST